MSKDVFYCKDEHIQCSQTIFKSFSELSASVNNSLSYYDDTSIWDLFMINYNRHENHFIHKDVEKNSANSLKEGQTQTDQIGVTNMMIILLNHEGKASSDKNKNTKSCDIEKSQDEKKETVSPVSPLSPKKTNEFGFSFKNVKEKSFNDRIQTVNNILKKLESKYFRDKFENEEDRIKGTSNLPFSYVVEMFRDINDVMLIYKENLIKNVEESLLKSQIERI